MEEHELNLSPSRESPNGFHYYGLYRDCPRKWYIKYILGLSPPTTKKALIFGGVIHAAKEAYYREGFDLDALLATFHKELDARASEYERRSDYENDKHAGPLMLDAWASTYRDWDSKNLQILSIEQPFELPLGPAGSELYFTVKPDLIARRGDGEIIVYDTKTTRWSIDKAFQNARLDDQMTSYVWAWNKQHPEAPCKTAIIDAMYQKSRVVKTERSEEMIITPFAQSQFEDGMYGTILEITQKVLALQHYPWTMLFPRNGRICGLFGCEYEPICRSQIPPDKRIPGYDIDPWIGEVEKWLTVTQSWSEDWLSRNKGLDSRGEES